MRRLQFSMIVSAFSTLLFSSALFAGGIVSAVSSNAIRLDSTVQAAASDESEGLDVFSSFAPGWWIFVR